MKKDVFMDGHKWLDVMKDCKRFLNTIEEFKYYLVEFDKNGKIKDKIYLLCYIIGVEDRQLVIIIIYDEYSFSINDNIWKAWTRIGDIFLHPKSWRQIIIVSKFLLPFGYLNIFFIIWWKIIRNDGKNRVNL